MAQAPQRAGSMRRTVLSCGCPQNQEEQHCTGGGAGNTTVSLQATMNQLPQRPPIGRLSVHISCHKPGLAAHPGGQW
jgi:hypothetical protein